MIETYFKDLIKNDDIVKSLEEMGYVSPTLVQEKVLPVVLAGKDVIVNSKTGSGKTAAFGIPIISSLSSTNKKIKALILAPTRELAIQVDEEISNISKYISYKSTCVYGQHNITEEIKVLNKGVSVVCGTPGRVLDHLVNTNMDLSELEYLVFDEADRMLDMGFIEQIQNILEYTPKNRQTMMFSATIPFALENVCLRYMNNPVTIKIESETMTVDKIKQGYYKVENRDKLKLIKRLIVEYRPDSVIVFCNTRWQVDKVSAYLNKGGMKSKGIHGGISQSGRIRSMDSFKDGKYNILVATDVAARGIHIDDLDMVINFDLPDDNDNYVHRIGRTGRAGKNGIAINLVSSESQYTLYEIEEHIGVMIEKLELQSKEEYSESLKLAKKKYKLSNEKIDKPKNEKFKGEKSKRDKPKSSYNKNTKKKPKQNAESNVKIKKDKKNDKNPDFVFKFNSTKEVTKTPKETKVVSKDIQKPKKGLFKKLVGIFVKDK